MAPMEAQHNTSTRILVGTSGWAYQHWRGVFYPRELTKKRWLQYYSQRFATVEVNYSFYRLPAATALTSWGKTVPPNFVFAVKGSRYITHRLKLRDAAEAVARFVAQMALLDSHLGPILWQLPPTLKPDVGLIREFVAILPKHLRHVFEFRRTDWHEDAILMALAEGGCHLCVHDWNDVALPRLVLGDCGYLRLHGSKVAWSGKYSEDELASWAQWIGQMIQGREAWFFVYFNNDAYGNAPADAGLLLSLLSRLSSADGR